MFFTVRFHRSLPIESFSETNQQGTAEKVQNTMYVSCWSQCTLGKCSEAQLQAELPAPSFSFEVETKTNKEKHVQTTSWCPASSLTLFTEETSDLVLHVCLSLLQLLLHRPGTRYNTRGLWNATEPPGRRAGKTVTRATLEQITVLVHLQVTQLDVFAQQEVSIVGKREPLHQHLFLLLF